MTGLLDAPSAWVQLLDDEDERRLTVLELDEAVVDGAPWEGFSTQLSVTVTLLDPDEQGQPYDDEQQVLLGFRRALEQAVEGHGRLVATITMDGVREHLAYVDAPALVEAWRESPPEGFGTHDAEVELLEDPRWLGLREVAGVLPEDEAPLRAPTT